MRLSIGSFACLLGGVLAAQVVPYDNVANTKDIMKLLVIPASNALFDVKESPTDSDWTEYRKQALLLSEAGNLLMTPGRMRSGPTKGAVKGKSPAANSLAWNQAAKQMRDAGKLVLKAAETKNADLLSGDAGDQILTSCSTCHERYLIK